MENILTLHCFAGDAQSLAIILLADYLGVKLSVRYLKPINLTEKLYKQSLTKTFPMLQVEQSKGGSLFLERSNTILRYLVRSFNGQQLYDENAPNQQAALNDQILDTIYQEVLPPFFTIQAQITGIVELEDRDIAEIEKELGSSLKILDGSLNSVKNLSLSLFDFPIFALMVSLQQYDKLKTLASSQSNLTARLSKMAEDKKFASLSSAFRSRQK